MRLKSISITNYRSIGSTDNLGLDNYSILIGKNNEGKTNVLNAIRIAVASIKNFRILVKRGLRFKGFYDYKRDYPVSLVNDKRAQPTSFVLAFELDEEDRKAFYKAVSIRNNGRIILRITFERVTGSVFYSFSEKRGRGATSYKDHLEDILRFLSSNIVFQYIPAIRTEGDSKHILNNLIKQELNTLENDDEYNQAFEIIKKKKEQLLEELNSNVYETIKRFIPSIKGTKIDQLDASYHSFDEEDSVSFLIDDGNETSIESKGDGVKSLVAMALLNGIKKSSLFRIIAIEEPESHLHYEAIHQIETVLKELSEFSQIIISTHSPVFVNRKSISSNIIVDEGVAKRATSIESIRDLLGIKLSDNLYSTDKMIIVEGSDDAKAISHILCLLSPRIVDCIDNKYLSFIDLGGSSNLRYKTSLLSNLMIDYYVILDGDKAGKSAFKECKEKGLITDKNTYMVSLSGGGEAETEFEDCLRKDVYKKYLVDTFGVDIDAVKLKACAKKKKWSDRLKDIFDMFGKTFDDKTEETIKRDIAEIVTRHKDASQLLQQPYLELFTNIAHSIEQDIQTE